MGKSYITVTDLSNAIPAATYTYLQGDDGETRLTQTISAASSEADRVLNNNGHTTPLHKDMITDGFKLLIIRITLYMLYMKEQGSAPADIKDDYLRTLEELKNTSSLGEPSKRTAAESSRSITASFGRA